MELNMRMPTKSLALKAFSKCPLLDNSLKIIFQMFSLPSNQKETLQCPFIYSLTHSFTLTFSQQTSEKTKISKAGLTTLRALTSV